jgi:hypothetical protein
MGKTQFVMSLLEPQPPAASYGARHAFDEDEGRQ